ncbi:MAG: protein translocase subunit SecF [Candidatus Rokubacteria bacterium]|nr:protein translocase subunit SecF [Candidatus Rokubacteria bacterium]
MFRILGDTNYDFIGKRRWAYLLSAVFIVVGVGSILMPGVGLRYGIDFAGGTLVQLRFAEPVRVEAIRAALAGVQLGESVIQQFGDPQEYLIRVAAGGGLEETSQRVTGALQGQGLPGFEVRRLEFVGPQVGRDLQLQALQAVAWGIVGILIYTAIRFDFKGGVAAVVALLHDVLVTLGAFSLTGRELNLPVLAALLTIVGYSINDTIVVFDRIRENRGKGIRKGQTLADVINASINQTLSRTLLTSLTVFLVLVVLYLFGGEVLRDFSFALLVGVITGTYSSVFVAAPLVVDWEARAEARARGRKAVAKA